MFINGWADEEDKVHIYNGILFSQEKEWNLIICHNIDGPWGHYAKRNKSERGRPILYISLLCGI